MDDPDGFNSPVLLVIGKWGQGAGPQIYMPGDVLPTGMEAREWVRLAHAHRLREARPCVPDRLPDPW